MLVNSVTGRTQLKVASSNIFKQSMKVSSHTSALNATTKLLKSPNSRIIYVSTPRNSRLRATYVASASQHPVVSTHICVCILARNHISALNATTKLLTNLAFSGTCFITPTSDHFLVTAVISGSQNPAISLDICVCIPVRNHISAKHVTRHSIRVQVSSST